MLLFLYFVAILYVWGVYSEWQQKTNKIKQYTVFIPISGTTHVYFQNQLNTHINNVFVI